MRAVHGILLALTCVSCGGDPVAVEQEIRARDTRAAAQVEEPVPEVVPTEPISIEEREDGLMIAVFTTGKGRQARAGSELLVHYSARVEGQEQAFDSSHSRGLPDRWRLGSGGRPRLIRGLDLALRGRSAGFRAQLTIPSALGWGAEGFLAAGVGPNANLIYDIHVLEIR